MKVEVEDHPVFSRDAENVLSEAAIPFTKAVFGGTVEVESLKGMANIQVKPGTQDGTEVVIKGAGMNKVGTGAKGAIKGDHIITLRIEVPTELNAEQTDALHRFAILYDNDSSSRRKMKS